MGLDASKAFKTYICIRKMIIDEVHHLLRFLTIILSYSRSSAFGLLVADTLGTVRWLSAQKYFYISVTAFKSMPFFMFGVKIL